MTKDKTIGLILVLQAVTLMAQVTGAGSPRAAHADVQELPNPGERQLEMIEQLKGINARLDKLLGILQGGEVQVKVAKPDEGK